MTVFYYVKFLGSPQYLTVSSIVHSWLEKRWHLLMQGNRYNILYLCYSSTWLLGTLRSGNLTATRTTKNIGLVGKTTALHLHHSFLYNKFSAFLHDRECEVVPNFTFLWRKQASRTKFYFSFWTWIFSLGIQLQKGLPTFAKISGKE